MSFSPADPSPAVDTSPGKESPTTGDAEVDAILDEFEQAGARGVHAQMDAAATAHRRLQARLSAQ